MRTFPVILGAIIAVLGLGLLVLWMASLNTLTPLSDMIGLGGIFAFNAGLFLIARWWKKHRAANTGETKK